MAKTAKFGKAKMELIKIKLNLTKKESYYYE